MLASPDDFRMAAANACTRSKRLAGGGDGRRNPYHFRLIDVHPVPTYHPIIMTLELGQGTKQLTLKTGIRAVLCRIPQLSA